MYRYDIHRITYDKNVDTVSTGFLSVFQLLTIKCSTGASPLQIYRMSERTTATASLFVFLSSSTQNVLCFCDITLLRWVTCCLSFEGTQWLHLQKYRGLGPQTVKIESSGLQLRNLQHVFEIAQIVQKEHLPFITPQREQASAIKSVERSGLAGCLLILLYCRAAFNE